MYLLTSPHQLTLNPRLPRLAKDRIPGLIGLVSSGTQRSRELMLNRALSDTTIEALPTMKGNARATSVSPSKGVFTARRAWANWELGAVPFTFFAYFQLDTYSGATAAMVGYMTGAAASGYSINQTVGGTGVRSYHVASTNLTHASSAVWPLGVPILAALTFDGVNNLLGYFNGVLDATSGGAGTPTYDGFSKFCVGREADAICQLIGKFFYAGLVNRVMLQPEIASLAQDPFSIYEQRSRRLFFDVISGIVTAPALGYAE